MPAGVGGGFNQSRSARWNLRASVSYVTGAHNMKFGYQGGFKNPSQTYTYFNEVIHVRFNNGVPNQLTQGFGRTGRQRRSSSGTSADVFYAQDQWTHGRLTLQGGVRYDHLLTTYPDSSVGGTGFTVRRR